MSSSLAIHHTQLTKISINVTLMSQSCTSIELIQLIKRCCISHVKRQDLHHKPLLSWLYFGCSATLIWAMMIILISWLSCMKITRVTQDVAPINKPNLSCISIKITWRLHLYSCAKCIGLEIYTKHQLIRWEAKYQECHLLVPITHQSVGYRS